MLLRRGHLYAGLLMLPWVLLYGITGFLFNHPEVFADTKILRFGQGEMGGTSLEGLPTVAHLASNVVEALNSAERPSYRLLDPESARFERGGLSARVAGPDGKSYTVSLLADGSGGTVREVPAEPAPAAQPGARRPEAARPQAERTTPSRPEATRGESGPPVADERPAAARNRPGTTRDEAPLDGFAAQNIAPSEWPVDRIKSGLPTVLARIGLAGAEVIEVRAAPLSFLVESDGLPWRATFDAQAGRVVGRPFEEAVSTSLSTRRFLLRLHTAHGYPSEFNARWVWAVIVDVMSSLMIFWALSGLVMWWQIKRTRRIGAAALVLSALAAAWVGLEMHGLLVAANR